MVAEPLATRRSRDVSTSRHPTQATFLGQAPPLSISLDVTGVIVALIQSEHGLPSEAPMITLAVPWLLSSPSLSALKVYLNGHLVAEDQSHLTHGGSLSSGLQTYGCRLAPNIWQTVIRDILSDPESALYYRFRRPHTHILW